MHGCYPHTNGASSQKLIPWDHGRKRSIGKEFGIDRRKEGEARTSIQFEPFMNLNDHRDSVSYIQKYSHVNK